MGAEPKYLLTSMNKKWQTSCSIKHQKNIFILISIEAYWKFYHVVVVNEGFL